MDNQMSDLTQILAGAGTPVSAVIVFLLWRLNKEVGELKTELKAYTEVLSRYFPGPK